MATVTIVVKQLGKAAKSHELESGTSIRDLLRNLAIDASGKTFTVTKGDTGAVQDVGVDYIFGDGDQLRITANNQAA